MIIFIALFHFIGLAQTKFYRQGIYYIYIFSSFPSRNPTLIHLVHTFYYFFDCIATSITNISDNVDMIYSAFICDNKL